MLEQQGTKSNSAVSSGYIAPTTLQESDYRRIIGQLHNEIVAKNARLKGVQALTVMFHETEEKSKRMEEKAKNYEMTLKRAEARIAQLNKICGLGPQAAFRRGVVMPGISRKDFQSVTKENLKLKEALDHILPKKLGGHEIILKNKELYNLVSTLKEDLTRSENHIKELESALRNCPDAASSTVPEFMRKIKTLERSLDAKQVFCEVLLKENEQLKKLSEDESISKKWEKMRDDVDGQNQRAESPIPQRDEDFKEMKELKEENQRLQEHVQQVESDLEKCNSALKEKVKVLEKEKEKLIKQVTEMKREKDQENQRKIAQEKEFVEMKKKCDMFFQQVTSLNAKQKEAEEELERMRQAFGHQGKELEEQKTMNKLMTESLKSYEDDFRRENEEKGKYQKMLDRAQQETERIKRENQSHMATIQHLENEFERMNKLLIEAQKKPNQGPPDFMVRGCGPRQMVGVAGSRSAFYATQPMQVVADGDGIDEVEGKHQHDAYSMPTTKSETASAPSLIECPYCSRSYPYHLIEGHVQDCMEDSMFMDNKD